MRAYYWVGTLAVGALLTASAAAVFDSSRESASDDMRATAVKNVSPPLIRESQSRQKPTTAPKTSGAQRVVTTKYDSWVVTCVESVSGAAKKTCTAQLKAMNQNRREILMDWQIGLNKDGHFVTAFYVPPSLAIKHNNQTVGGPLLIQNGLELKFGNGPARRINYIWCGPKQCFAEALIDDAFVKEANASTVATITVHTAGGAAIPMQIPIKGIDKAISLTRK
jgi:invasion protein IalB